LRDARAAGLTVTTDGALLTIRGPRKAERLARQLLARKTEVLEALAADLPADWHELWDERAAIMEFDGGLPRERAEAAALAEVLKQMSAAKLAAPGPTKYTQGG